MRKLAAAALMFGLISACSTGVKTRPGFQVTPASNALSTKGYALPMLQYDLALTYKLHECPSPDPASNTSELKIKVEALVAADYVAGEWFEIDYAALASPLKISDFVIETYANGTLKSINVSADDKTGDIIKSAVEIGTSIASLGMGSVIPRAGFQNDDPVADAALAVLDRARRDSRIMTCDAEARQMLADAVALRGEVETLTGEINRAAKSIEAITVRAGLKLTRDSDMKALGDIHDAMMPKLETLAAKQAALAKAERKLIFAEDRLWPNDPYTTSEVMPFSPAAMRWFDKMLNVTTITTYDPDVIAREIASRTAAFVPADRQKLASLVERQAAMPAGFTDDQICRPGEAEADCLRRTLGIFAEIEPDRPPLGPCPSVPSHNQARCISSAGSVDARANVAVAGVFYRDPARGRLYLCDRGRPCRNGKREPVALTDWDSVPQLGQLRFARFTNGPFQNNLLAIALRADGSAEKFQFAEKSSILASMAAATAAGLAKIDTAAQDRDKRRRQEILDRRADIKYERDEIAAIRSEAAAVRTDELSLLQFEFDKITKERALLDARIPPSVSKDYTNETVRLEAIAAQLRAKIAIKEAEAKLSE